MSWYVASTVNTAPDSHYVFINNSTEEAKALAGYSYESIKEYSLLDIVLVGGGGAGGFGGSGGEGLAGAGGGSGNKTGYINTSYTDPDTNTIYDYSITGGGNFTLVLSNYNFDTIKVILGAGGTPSFTSNPGGTTTLQIISNGNVIASQTASGGQNGVSSFTAGNGFNGGGAGTRKGVIEGSPGSGNVALGGENGSGAIGGGIGAGIQQSGSLWPGGTGAGGSGVELKNNGTTLVTGGSTFGGGSKGGDGVPYTGAGGGGGGYSGGVGGNGGKGYAILYFHN
jgi:hypothetical protein